MTLPFRLQRRHVDNDAAAGIGALPQTNSQHVAGDPKVFHRASEGKGVGWYHTDIGFHVNKAVVIEIFRVHRRRIDVGENFELATAAHVIAIT